MSDLELFNIPLFDGASPETLEKFARLVAHKTVEAGGVLFRQDDEGTEAFIVIKGAIRIERLAEDGKYILLNILGPGEIFGEMALITGNRRTAQAVAQCESAVMIIRKPNFQMMMRLHPRMSERLMCVLSDRLTHTGIKLEETGLNSLKSRLAGVLLDLLNRFGDRQGAEPALFIKLTQSDLAALAISSREHVNKLIKAWEREGIIDFNRGNIKVIAYDKLREINDNSGL